MISAIESYKPLIGDHSLVTFHQKVEANEVPVIYKINWLHYTREKLLVLLNQLDMKHFTKKLYFEVNLIGLCLLIYPKYMNRKVYSDDNK